MATFAQTSGRTIDQMFAEFDEANPALYARFRQIALSLIHKGKTRYSSKTIVCVMRYEHDLETAGDAEFKINDVVTSRYARKFIAEFPEHGEFFELRELRAAREIAGSPIPIKPPEFLVPTNGFLFPDDAVRNERC